MGHYFKLILAIAIPLFASITSRSQNINVLQGAILKKGSNIRIGSARVYNKNKGYVILTDKLGIFAIKASIGDTLQISHQEYSRQEIVIDDFKDVIIYMQSSNVLAEVIVKGKSVKQDLKEVEDMYRSKGIYYNGKPPLSSLVHPVTFFNELFSKNGKRAKRLIIMRKENQIIMK